MPTSGNRFRGGGSPLRVSQVAETTSQRLAREASDARNQATIEQYNNPLEKQIRELELIDRFSKLTDSYIKFVADLNRQRNEIADRDALRQLSENDPYGFVKYAEDKLGGMEEDDFGFDVWNTLLRQTYEKIEDEQWAQNISGPYPTATLEEFNQFLQSRLAAKSPGSAEAAKTILAITQVSQAIRAQSEAKLDQAAYLDFISATNELDGIQKYASYLTDKLQRATDPEAQTQIVDQIGQLHERYLKFAEADRRRQVAKAVADYRAGRKSTGQAALVLEGVANDPNITPQEIVSIQQTITGIYEDSQNRITSSQNAGKQAFADKFELDAKAYNDAKGVVQGVLNSGGIPTEDQIRAVQVLAETLAVKFELSAQYETTVPGKNARLSDAASIRKFKTDLPGLIDTNTLKGINVSAIGRDTFRKELMGRNPSDQAELIVDRIMTIAAAQDRLITPNAQRDAELDKRQFSAEALKSARELAVEKAPTTASEEAELLIAHLAYQGEVAKQMKLDKHLDPSVTPIPVLDRDAFAKMVATARDANHLRTLTRMDLPLAEE